MRVLIILLFFIAFLSYKKKKFINTSKYVHNFEKKSDSFLNQLPIITFPFSSKNITNKVEYYDSFGGYLIDTTFTNLGLSKIDSLNNQDIIVFYKGTKINHDFNIHKSNKTIVDGIINVYNNSDDYNYNISSQLLFPTFKNKYKNFNIIGSYSQYHGENDILGVFYTLTSFDKKGKQIDYLIIYNRFSFEISYEYDFEIDEVFNIKIIKKTISYFDNDLESEKETPLITEKIENYFFTDEGTFKKTE